MAWFAVYETATGRLRSVGTVITDPLKPGLDKRALPERPLDSTMWNETTRSFVPRPVKVLVDRLDDIHNTVDFGKVYRKMKPVDKATTDNLLIRLLGRNRFRNQIEPFGIGEDDG